MSVDEAIAYTADMYDAMERTSFPTYLHGLFMRHRTWFPGVLDNALKAPKGDAKSTKAASTLSLHSQKFVFESEELESCQT